MDAKERLILALDVPNYKQARKLVEITCEDISLYKVGLQLFCQCGPSILTPIPGQVFLDLKFNDTPQTVANAMMSLNDHIDSEKISMITVHALGGTSMLKAAVENAPKNAKVLAVSILTSLGDDDLASMHLTKPVRDYVKVLVKRAIEAGAHGCICSPHEAKEVRRIAGEDFLIVCPGIRDVSPEGDDQKRYSDPKTAILNGADYLVVGRPIHKSGDPAKAVRKIQSLIQEALDEKGIVS